MAPWIKRIAYGLGGLILVGIAAAGTVYAMSESRFRRTYSVPAETIGVANDSATLARGEHLVSAIAGCADCHGPGLRGNAMFDQAPMGRLVALNLTSGNGGVGALLTPEVIERAVRHGIGADGRPLRIMPADDFQYMSDDDVRAVITYVRHVAPADNVLAPTRLMLLPRALLLAGKMPLLPAERMGDSAVKPMSVAVGTTAEYGGYLAVIAGCRKCHGPGLSGGHMDFGDPSWGPSANLTRSGNLGKWTEAQFLATIRSGQRPDGSPLRNPMPWRTVRNMTDAELHAIWLYLQAAPPRQFGTH
jgi:mono/diheme cytochrome c family protein